MDLIFERNWSILPRRPSDCRSLLTTAQECDRLAFMISLKRPSQFEDSDIEQRLYRRWHWMNSRRMPGTPSPFLAATPLFSARQRYEHLLRYCPAAAPLACVQETSVLQVHFASAISPCRSLGVQPVKNTEFYMCAPTRRSNAYVVVAVVGKGCFEPLEARILKSALSSAQSRFVDLDVTLLLAQFTMPNRLSLMEVCSLTPQVTIADEQQYELVDPHQFMGAA